MICLGSICDSGEMGTGLSAYKPEREDDVNSVRQKRMWKRIRVSNSSSSDHHCISWRMDDKNCILWGGLRVVIPTFQPGEHKLLSTCKWMKPLLILFQPFLSRIQYFCDFVLSSSMMAFWSTGCHGITRHWRHQVKEYVPQTDSVQPN